MDRKAGILAVGVLFITVVGCTQIPRQELSQYRNAFAEVQKTSEDILIDFAAAKEKAEKQLSAAAAPAAGPSPFSTDLSNGSQPQINAVEVRRTALRTIDKFNNVLVTLAEGKSIESVQNTAGGLVQAAGKFVVTATGSAVPGLSAITGLVQTLIGEFEKARLRKEFEKAVRSGAPIIDKMLAALIEEREDHITLRADEATQRQVAIIRGIRDGVVNVRDLFKDYGPPSPTASDHQIAIEKSLNETLKPAEKGFAFKLPITLTYTAGKPAFGQEQKIIASQVISQIGERVAAYQANVLQYQSLKSALNNYGTMLERTRSSLWILVDALDQPQSFETISEELFEVAFSIKRDIEAFKAERKAAN